MSKGLATEDMIASPVDAADALWRLSWRSLEGKWVVSSGCVSVQTPHSDCTCIQNTFRKTFKRSKYNQNHQVYSHIILQIMTNARKYWFQLQCPIVRHTSKFQTCWERPWRHIVHRTCPQTKSCEDRPTWKFEQHLSRDNMAMIGHGWYRPDMDSDNTSSMVSFVIFLTLA